MDDQTRQYDPYAQDDPCAEDEPIQLDDVLEPDEAPQPAFGQPGQYDDEAYEDEYAENEYSYEHQAEDGETRFRVAMGVFNTVSILVGVAVILLLVALLLGLFNWLQSDILHSLTLIQSELQ